MNCCWWWVGDGGDGGDDGDDGDDGDGGDDGRLTFQQCLYVLRQHLWVYSHGRYCLTETIGCLPEFPLYWTSRVRPPCCLLRPCRLQ